MLQYGQVVFEHFHVQEVDHKAEVFVEGHLFLGGFLMNCFVDMQGLLEKEPYLKMVWVAP